MDFLQSARLGVIEFHRIGGVAAEYGVLRRLHRNIFLSTQTGHRNRDGAGRRIDSAHQPSHASLLPVLLLLLMKRFEIGVRYYDNFQSSDRIAVGRPLAAHANSVTRL